jgi:HAD superfamily hydrolase (TIGR01509 family)
MTHDPAVRRAFDASIFDMDGLLVDSEPLWHQAEIEILRPLGVPLVVDACRQTKGMFVDEVTRYWYARYPWEGPAPEVVATEVVDRVIELVTTVGVKLPGVDEVLERCRSYGLSVALASSSQHRLIDAVLEHFSLADAFGVVHSAEHEPYGKPHPGIFLTTASRLGAAPDRCLVFEDAAAGVLAAKAAQMACIAVPDPEERDGPAFGIADAVLGSLAEADDARLAAVAAAHRGDPAGGPKGPSGP